MAPRAARAPPTAPQQLPFAGALEPRQSAERFWGGPLEWFRRWTWGPHVQVQTLHHEFPARQSNTNEKQALRQSTTPLHSDGSSSSSGRLSFGLSGSRFSTGNISASSSSSSSSVADRARLRRSHQSPLTGCLPSRSSSAYRSSSSNCTAVPRKKPVASPPRSAAGSRAQQQHQRYEGQPQQQQQTHRAQLQLPQLQLPKEQQCQKQQLDSFLTFAAHPPQNWQEKGNDAAAAKEASLVAAAAECLTSSSGDLPSELRAAAEAAIRAAPAYEAKNECKSHLSIFDRHFKFVLSSQLNGKTVELKNREEVAASIHRLHCEYGIPLCRQFGFRYSFLAEQHPLHRKAGSVIRKPLNASKELMSESKSVDSRSRRRRSSVSSEGAPHKSNSCSGSSCSNNGSVSGGRWWYCIRIRMRQLQKPEELLKLPTQLGIFFHELAHLKFMNHGLGFARLLANIFRSATLMGLFDPGLETELPSPWLWERVVFSCGGFVSDELLQQLLLADPKARAAAGAACDSARAAAPSDAVSPLNIPPAGALQQAGSACTEGSTSPTTAASTPTQGGLSAATDAASVAAGPRKCSSTTSAASAPKAGEASPVGTTQPQQTQKQEQRSPQQQHHQRQQGFQPQEVSSAAVPRSLGSCLKSSALIARTATPRNFLERRRSSCNSSSSAVGSKASISTCASSSVLARGATHAKPSPRPKASTLLNLQQQRPRTPRALSKKPTPRKMCSRRSSCSAFNGGGNSTSTIRSSSTKPQQQRKRSGSVPGAQVGKKKSTPRKRGEAARRALAGPVTDPVKPAASRAAACVPPLVPIIAAAG
ncbi:hypothetical protein Emag_006279 [Eimeria magna]